MTLYDPLIHPALLDPRLWGDVNLYELAPAIEREPLAGGAHNTPDRRFAVKHLRLSLFIDDEKESISGTATLTLAPFAEGFTHFDLDAAEMNVTSVRVDEVSVAFETHLEKLSIELGRAYGRDEPLTVEIAYSCRPRKGLFFIKPDESYPNKPRQIWSQGENDDAHWWFPCADVTNQKMTTELIATVSDDRFVLSNGSLISVTNSEQERKRTYHWRQNEPHPAYLVSVVVGEYEHVAHRYGELPVDYYVYREQREAGVRLFANTPQMIEFFEKTFGCSYPYPKYSQVLVHDFLFGAMENTSATTMTDRALLDDRAAMDLDYDDIVAHELAHQWWGDLVTCKDWSQIWLNESFASYSEYLWCEKKRGRDEARFVLFQDFLTYLREDQKAHRRPIVFNRYRYSEEVMDRHAYQKGECVLAMLRSTLGDEAFFRSLAHYLKKHAFGVAETNDFKIAIEEATGHNLYWFFDQWLYGAGYPELEVSYAWEREHKLLKVSVKQIQAREEGVAAVFRLPVEIELIWAEPGQAIDSERRGGYHVIIEKAEQDFYFPCEAKPRLVIFDKGDQIFKLMRFSKSAQELMFQLKRDSDMLGRVRAARELAAFKSDDVVSELKAVVEGSDFWGVRMTAALTLGEIGTEEARAVLVAAYRACEDTRVRRGIVWAMGNFKDDVAVAFLREALDADQSYFVGVAAVRALANIGSDSAYDILASALTRTSWQEVIRAAIFHGFAVAKDKRAIEHALAHTRYGEHPAVRAAAIACLGALGKELHANSPDDRVDDRAGDRVVDRLIELLHDKSIRSRVSAVRALGKIGNRRALGPLQDAARRECLDQLKAAIEDAIESVEKKGGK